MGVAFNPEHLKLRKLAKALRFIDIDFETRCKAKIKETGAWVYSEDPSCKILIMNWSIDGGPIHSWRYTKDKLPKPIRKALQRGYLIRAHNAFFEYCIWNHVAVPQLGWPKLGISRFYCTQAQATSLGYQPKLESAGEQMHLEVQKSKEGTRLIQKFCVPNRKKDGGTWNEPEDYPEDFDLFDYTYCHDDVATQRGIANKAPLLIDQEHEVFKLTELMNVRGVPIDVPMVKGAISIIEQFSKRAHAEAKKIVGDAFDSLTQRDKVKDWLNANGCKIPNMQGPTIERKLKKRGKMPKKTYRVLELRYQIAKSSTAKYYTALARLGCDDAVHESLKYHIAQTGRWGGRGLQIQNFVKPTLPKGTDYDYLAEVIATGDIDYVSLMYGDVMQALSSAVRSMIKAPEGHKFIAADYSQIEARIGFWYVNEYKALDMFRQGGDLYCDMASDIYGRLITKLDELERAIGKAAILGLGFGMGAKKFRDDVYEKADLKIPQEFADKAVKAYRKKYRKIVKAWAELEEAAISAIENPGAKFYALNKRVYYRYKNKRLSVRLPSGREIHYIEPKISMSLPPWGGKKLHKKISHMGTSSVGGKWTKQYLYGGKLFNNIVQGTARDIMAKGMLYAESKGYYQIATIHDESIACVPANFGSVEQYERFLVKRDRWARDIPVVAEGWVGQRFRK